MVKTKATMAGVVPPWLIWGVDQPRGIIGNDKGLSIKRTIRNTLVLRNRSSSTEHVRVNW